MENQISMLRVKIKSLADEARVIRREELKALRRNKPGRAYNPSGSPGGAKKPRRKASPHQDQDLFKALNAHRRVDLRLEQRAALLAYAYLRGVPYCQVEPRAIWRGWDASLRKEALRKRVAALAAKFGGLPTSPAPVTVEAVTAWVEAAVPAAA